MTNQELFDKLSKEFCEIFPSAVLSKETINKASGTYEGFRISFRRGELDHVFNLDEINRLLREGKDFSFIVEDIEDAVGNSIMNPAVDLTILNSYENLKPNLFADVISINDNKELLSKIPHKPIDGNMAVVFKVALGNSRNENPIPVGTLNYDTIANYDVSIAQLYEDAINNSSYMNPSEITSVSDFLIGEEYLENPNIHLHDNAKFPIRILTTQTGLGGAAVMLDSNARAKAAKEIGGNYYIVPLSKFSIAIPESISKSRELSQEVASMLKDKGFSMIGELMHYDTATREFRTAKDWEYISNRDLTNIVIQEQNNKDEISTGKRENSFKGKEELER